MGKVWEEIERREGGEEVGKYYRRAGEREGRKEGGEEGGREGPTQVRLLGCLKRGLLARPEIGWAAVPHRAREGGREGGREREHQYWAYKRHRKTTERQN